MSSFSSENQLCCPITYEIFEDPVKMPDGHTYERAAITKALLGNGLSPITRIPMKIEEAITDYTMLSLVAKVSDESTTTGEQKFDPAEMAEKDKITGKIEKNGNSTIITLQTKDDGETHSKSVVFVIDISGSMDTEILNGDERDGFNILDIVKHAVLLCIESLRPIDSVSIIAYSSSAFINLPMTRMSKSGKIIAKNALKSLEPQKINQFYFLPKVFHLQIE